MSETRIQFIKTDRARYISHLDLMRTFQRAFLRADLHVRHTEGFNPHAYVSIALPLSVGFSSQCEILEFGLPEGEDAGAPVGAENAIRALLSRESLVVTKKSKRRRAAKCRWILFHSFIGSTMRAGGTPLSWTQYSGLKTLA